MIQAGDIYTLAQVQQVYNGRTVLNIDRLSLKAGEILALVGPSGAGKSTLLRLLAFLERPSSGTLTYKNEPINENWPDLATRRQVTMVFQRPVLLRRSVLENVAYGLKLRGREDWQTAVQEAIKQLGLQELADAAADTLSGGEMQRAALARALVLQPKVLLLDEPTANLDPYNIKLIEEMIQQVNERRKTAVVIVTHNIFQARRVAHRVGLLLNGRLVEVSETESFFEAPSRSETAAFIRGDIIY
ncbi:Tungstate ABC transporter, ATP-binding protein [hydrothermal vent metagenome]|uniref:Tungstate ABC transporter, ATP-binding protein n=1 Tax=hydrothermal vent metagenome TaxID=652676 RepID=A0A3B0VC51_9ZZZZ